MEVARDFARTYPTLSGVKITHDWSGAVERTPSALPLIGRLGRSRPHIVHGVGWSGHGVGPSSLGAKMLARLALGVRHEWSEAGIVDQSMGAVPPEPVRYLGGVLGRSAVTRKEYAEWDDRTPAFWDVALSNLAPNH